MAIEYDTTPLGMLNNAMIWHTLYRQNITLNTDHKVIAIYCLLIGLEMLLKAYLNLLNPKYNKHANLKVLGHDFKKISDAFHEEKNVKFINEIESLLTRYNLKETDMDLLRYPKKGDRFIMYGDYFLLSNDFDSIFDLLRSEINAGMAESFYKK